MPVSDVAHGLARRAMTFSNFAYGPIFSAAAQMVLTLLVWRRAPTPTLARSYAFFGTCLTLWCAGVAATFVVESPTAALRWLYLLHVGVLFLPLATLTLSLEIAGLQGTIAKIVAFIAILGLLATMPFGRYIVGVTPLQYSWWAVAGPGFNGFRVLMPAIALPTAAMIGWRRRSERVNKSRYTVLMIATILMTSAGIHDSLPLVGITRYPLVPLTIYPWGTCGAVLYGSLFAYATLQEHALDVRFRVSTPVAVIVRLVVTFAVGFVALFTISSFTGQLSPFAFACALAVLLVGAGVAMTATPRLLAAISESLHFDAVAEGSDHRGAVVQAADRLLLSDSFASIWTELRDALSTHTTIESFAWSVVDVKSRAVLVAKSHPKQEWISPEIFGAVAAELAKTEETFFELGSIRRTPDLPLDALDKLAEAGVIFVFNASAAPDIAGVLVVGRKRGSYSALEIEMLEHLAQRLGIAGQRVQVTGRASLAERHELLSLMGQGLAHDLQNLIVPVRTFVDVLGRSTRLTNQERQMQALVAENLASIRAYLSNAILFGTELKVRAISTDSAIVVAAAVVATSQRAEARGVRLQTDGPTIPIVGDPVLLERVMANLIANAIDASPEGAGVDIATRFAADNDAACEFCVSDRGPGIALAVRNNLFQPYVTTKGGGGSGPRGFGLGLALTQMIVGLHRGHVRFESRVGGGTIFIVQLPRQQTVPSNVGDSDSVLELGRVGR